MAKLVIDNGRVNCPRRGDLDVDLCVCCADLLAIEVEDGVGIVRCSGRPPRARAAGLDDPPPPPWRPL